jgi:hypothetical protein
LPAVITIYPNVDGVLATVRPLESVAPSDQALFAELEPTEQLARAKRFVERAEEDLDSLRPTSSGSQGISPEQVLYYSVKEQLYQVRSLLTTARRTAASQQLTPITPGVPPRQAAYSNRRAGTSYRVVSERRVLREIQAADDIHDYLRESVVELSSPGVLVEELTRLRHEAAMLHSMLTSVGMTQRVLLLIRPIGLPAGELVQRWSPTFENLFRDQLSFDVRRLNPSDSSSLIAFEVSGPGVWPLASAETGVHVWWRFHENLLPVSVWMLPGNEQSAKEQLSDLEAERRVWLHELALGRSIADQDPWPLGKIVRFYDEAGPTLDLRSGMSLPKSPTLVERKTLVLAGLALPPEMEV